MIAWNARNMVGVNEQNGILAACSSSFSSVVRSPSGPAMSTMDGEEWECNDEICSIKGVPCGSQKKICAVSAVYCVIACASSTGADRVGIANCFACSQADCMIRKHRSMSCVLQDRD